MHDLEIIVMHFIHQYQYGGVFLLLSLGMVGVPFPDEFIITFCGYQINGGQMALGKVAAAALLGSLAGMQISYWIGRKLGILFLHKIAPYIHLNEARLACVERWFQRYGDKLIVIGYFFPGFRHATAYFSGLSEFPYTRYLLLSGTGAIIWVATFITIGNVFGAKARWIIEQLRGYFIIGGLVLFVIVVVVYFYSIHKNKA
jgi:membrane protein DedA with SNARE-associated domain